MMSRGNCSLEMIWAFPLPILCLNQRLGRCSVYCMQPSEREETERGQCTDPCSSSSLSAAGRGTAIVSLQAATGASVGPAGFASL